MTGLEIIGLVQLVIIPLAGFIWRRVSKKIENEEVRDLVDDLVGAAEELNAAGNLTGMTKRDFVISTAKKRFPSIDDEALNVLIHSSLNKAGLGASASAKE